MSKYVIKIKPHHHVHECFPLACSESQRLYHCHMCTPPSLFVPALSARFSPVRQFVCVSYCVYTYIHAHTRLATPPPKKTHTKGVLFVYSRTHRLKKTRKDSNKERETKRDREEVFGGGSLELGSGWWSGPHLQVLEACLPRSVHTCLESSDNGMCQGQKSRDNQPNAHMCAHVCMETCSPSAH